MSESASPTAAAPHHARGVLDSQHDGQIVLAVPGTSYQIHLSVYQPVNTPAGKRLVGTIRGQARRIDVVRTGGRYIEPVMGRPRRIQGTVVAIDAAGQTLTVDAGVPMVCKVDGIQRADQFAVGQLVALDLVPGTGFTPA